MIWVILAQIVFLFAFGWWGLLFIPIVVLLVIILPMGAKQKIINTNTVNDKKHHPDNYSEIKRNAVNEIEGGSRLKVLNESLDIIGSTNNLTTLNSRFDVVSEHLSWLNISGIQLNGRPAISAISETNEFVNENIVRIATYSYDKAFLEVHSLKTKTAKENRVVKLFELLKQCEVSLKNNANIEASASKLNDIHLKTEELYSNINQVINKP